MAHKNKSNYSSYKNTGLKISPKPNPANLKSNVHKKPTEIYPLEEANDRLYDLFRNHDASDISHDLRRKLARFYQILMENQNKENFTRLLTLKDIGLKHFLDCLLVTTHTELQFPLLDLGTGPGFPGIPIQLKYPDQKVILAEGVQKRVEFLKTARHELDLKNMDIVGKNINVHFVYPVQGVITRAVEEIANTMKNVINSLQIGGRIYFMKGPNVDPEMERIPEDLYDYYKFDQDIAYDIPKTTHKRRLVIYKKIAMPKLKDWNEDDDETP
ncbi:MAG: 16S rRNA (guanine(527)-N(7))-methyltransferase RsmG [Pseudobdellovibrionaceae bacterium]